MQINHSQQISEKLNANCTKDSDLDNQSISERILKTCRSAQMWMAMEKVRRRYLVAFVKVNSSHLGDPACRRRIYIIMIRRLGWTNNVVTLNHHDIT